MGGMDDGARKPPVENVGDNISKNSEIYPSDDSHGSSTSISSKYHSEQDKVEARDVLEETSTRRQMRTREERDKDGRRTAEFIEFSNSRTQNARYLATSTEKTAEYFWGGIKS